MADINITKILGEQRSKTMQASLLSWEQQVMEEIMRFNPKRAQEARYASTVPIYMLPFKKQVEYMRQWRNISGIDDVINSVHGSVGSQDEQINSVFKSLHVLRGRGEESSFLRFDTGEDSFIGRYFRGMNLNFDERARPVRSGLLDPRSTAGTSHHFGPGIRSIPKVKHLEINPTGKMRGGAKFTTFDIETASLRTGEIREVSYKSGVTDARGGFKISGVTEEGSILFRPRAFARGSMGLKTSEGVLPHSLEEFMEGKYGLKVSDLPTEKMGNDYAQRMIPFLHNIRDSDYIIGHNISRFDIPQIFAGLTGTAAYQSADQSIIPGFKKLVDSVYEGIQPKIIDTLVLARNAPNLRGLGTADELARVGTFSTHSIENLLLETDLAEKIGTKELKRIMGDKGLHFGAVDDLVTLNLYKHLHSLKPKRLGGDIVSDTIRQQIVKSAAITPTTNIRMQENIADSVLKHIIGSSGIRTGDDQLNGLLERAGTGDHTAVEEAFKGIRSGRFADMQFDINPIEHQAISTRRLGYGVPKDLSTEINGDSLIFRSNIFDRAVYDQYTPRRDFSRGILDQKRISDEEMLGIQKTLHEAGAPWAGLSYEERSIGTVLSHLTADVNPVPILAGIKDLTSDTLVSRFEQFSPSAVAYATESGRPSLPIGLLQSAGFLSEDSGSILSLSSVDPTNFAKDPRVNLVYNFKEGEAQKLAEHLKNLAANPDDREVATALGIEHDLMSETDTDLLGPVSKFRKAVDETDLIDTIAKGETGVAVGQLQPQHARKVINALRSFTGMEDLSDRSMLRFGLPFMRAEGGYVETTGAVLTRHLNGQELGEVSKNVRHATKVFDAYKDLAPNKLKNAQVAASIGNDTVSQAIQQAYEAYQTFRPHMGKALGLGLIAGTGAILFKRHQENKQYNETMEQMPYESGGSDRYTSADLLQMSIDSGVNKSYQRYDPLKTAFVVSNLSDSAIGHTSMAWDKNNSLYGGVL